MDLFYSPDYVSAAHACDTTRKAAWIAASLHDRPIDGVHIVAPAPATPADLTAIHDPDYIATILSGGPRSLAESQGISWDPGLAHAIVASTGGAVAAAVRALETRANCGSLSSGLHHARRTYGAGFCTFNGLALAARVIADRGASILIVDLDAHCGGGTYEIAGRTPAITCVDVAVNAFDHYDPKRHDWTIDLVTDAKDYISTIDRRLAARTRPPDLVIYNAGMDPHEWAGGLPGIGEALLATRERLVFAWAQRWGAPVAFVLAGGYTGREMPPERLVDLHRLTIEAAV